MKKLLLYVLATIVVMVTWAALIFMGTVSGWFHRPIAKQETTQSFIEASRKEIDQQFTGNFAMAVLSGGTIEFEMFHSAGKPIDRYTVFQVSSMSKWISAFGIMKLVEDGRLDLDAPVSTYLTRWQLPASEFNNEKVTVRKLLSHTAGLTDGLGYSGFEAGMPVQTLEQSLTKASDADEGVSGMVHVGIEPGSEFRYSGGGFTLLQLIVEEVTDQPFATYMKDSVFEPLAMSHSSYAWNDSSTSQLAEFYNSDGTMAAHNRYTSLAATSLYTSLSDLELFFQAHLEGVNNEPIGRGVIKPASLKMMREPHGRTNGVDIWGLGTILYATTDRHDFIIGHDGKSTPPINTAVRLNPETGDGIIVLETGSPNMATKLASEWVFWKTGQVDTLLFPTLMDGMVTTIGIGWIVIVVVTIAFGFVGTRRRKG